MGVYDNVTIEYELPEPNLPKEGWQTKDLDCAMLSFVLSKEGRLFERVRGLKLVNDQIEETGEWKLADRNHEGVFHVYLVTEDMKDGVPRPSEMWVWHEFEIVMIDGVVIRVRNVEKWGKLKRQHDKGKPKWLGD